MAIWLAESETLPRPGDAALLASRIRVRFLEAEVWLFGSLARGRVRRASDIDPAVVLPDAAVAGPREHAPDVVAFPRSTFEALGSDPSALAATVRREGRRL